MIPPGSGPTRASAPAEVPGTFRLWCRGGACPRPAGEPGRYRSPGRIRTARGCSKRGSPLLGVSIRVGLGRGRNRNLPLPRIVSLWFFLFGQAKRKKFLSPRIRQSTRQTKTVPPGGDQPRPYDRTETRACLRAAGLRALRVGGGPYGATGTFLIQFRTPNSELRIDRGRRPLRCGGQVRIRPRRYRIRHRSRAGDHKDRPYGVD